ncbi:hypothetical protein [Vibrio campbellii]|uniref:hypothetical protein n=1 Tax=Vibrio campbellii TaxID=680 RepID=UPI000CD36E4D|nr:hypothetical protein [Vibrio campbellii]AUW07469.1 hypothetical protein C1N51_27920 [Vibrio campbellii]
MSKLRKKGASTSISLKTDNKPKIDGGITTVKKKVTTSYKVPPLTLRVSLADKKAIGDWVDELDLLTTHKSSAAKLYRALVEYKNNLSEEEVVELNHQLAMVIDKMP